ncbi:glutaredoxin [Candidatus Marinamargulisbacteria bacterium SCGC AG-414-C22]|nr:glutaredoxin [Candidatus Marinamargulisbacteria bacterium SCGC AG-414-C22]
MKKELTLYTSNFCFYCEKVLRYMERTSVEIPIKNISTDSNLREELINLGGKTQTPCLAINNEALYESDDIIVWLDENFNG